MNKTTTIDPKLIDQLLEQTSPEDLLGENGLIKQFAKAILERALQAEMSTHLGHEPGESVSNEAGNKRNGTTSKTVQGELGFLTPTAAPDGLGSQTRDYRPSRP
jgi:putative transposase